MIEYCMLKYKFERQIEYFKKEITDHLIEYAPNIQSDEDIKIELTDINGMETLRLQTSFKINNNGLEKFMEQFQLEYIKCMNKHLQDNKNSTISNTFEYTFTVKMKKKIKYAD